MTKIFTHWTIAFLTLAAITFYGLQEPYLKEVLSVKIIKLLEGTTSSTNKLGPDEEILWQDIPAIIQDIMYSKDKPK